jgi:hypothetical protein
MTEIWETAIEWTSDTAKAQFDEYQRLIEENAYAIMGSKQIAHSSGDYHRLQAQHMKETEHLRRLAVDLYSRFTRTVGLIKKIDGE